MCKPSPKPWIVARLRKDSTQPPTVDEIKKMLCESVDKTVAHGDSIKDFWMVLSGLNTSDEVFVALTGNGPTSKNNAYFIANTPKLLEALETIANLSYDEPEGDAVYLRQIAREAIVEFANRKELTWPPSPKLL